MMLLHDLLVVTLSFLLTTVGCQTLQSNPKDCQLTKPGVEYAGTISVTVSGYTCQAWTADTPQHNYFKSSTLFPEGSAAHAQNYCRNPDTTWGGGVWCYTTDTNRRWEVCNVSFCAFSTIFMTTVTSIVKNESSEVTVNTTDVVRTENAAVTHTNTMETVTASSLETVTTPDSLNATFEQGTTDEIAEARTTPFEIASTQVGQHDANIYTTLLTSASNEFEEELVGEMSVASLVITIITVMVVVIVVIVATILVWRITRPNPKTEERESFDNPSYRGNKEQADQAVVTLTNFSPDQAM